MLLRKRRTVTGPDATTYEKWATTFGRFSAARLVEEDAPKYRARRRRRTFRLTLKRRQLFAWVTNRVHRYRDFVLEAEASFGEGNGHSALGFVLRHADDGNYYYFLVSKNGMFRFDLVFNGNPTPLIAWVRDPRLGGHLSLRIVVRGTHFAFFADDRWIGEVDDETIGVGRIGFAAQNYDERDGAVFLLSRLALNSRPIDVERDYARWVEHVPVDPESRLRLAQAFFDQGQFAPAAVQIRRALKGREGAADELLLLARALSRLHMTDEALRAAQRALALDPDRLESIEEYASLLYLAGRHEEADAQLAAAARRLEDNPAMLNLHGNVKHALGEFGPAAEAYLKAAEIDPGMPQYHLNAARALLARDRNHHALEEFLRAARLLFAQEAYGDLSLVLAHIRRLDRGNLTGRAIAAKVLYRDGDRRGASAVFRDLVAEGSDDSAVSYLLALTLIETGQRREALLHLRRAVALEPEAVLYRFRLAENLFLLGEECGPALNAAVTVGPADPWVCNLAGQIAMDEGDLATAARYFAAAREADSDAPEIALNSSECLLRQGDVAAAQAVLDSHAPGDPRLTNQRGNIAARLGRHAEAVSWYEKALEGDPENPDYMKNCAAACIETDMILRAEELLNWLTETAPSPEVYNLNASLAQVKGERGRAELSLKAGLELDPESSDLRLNLALVFMEREDVDRARELVSAVLEDEPDCERAERVRDQIRARWERELRCAGCDRSWWVPREVPFQAALRLHGQPPDACPAGRCAECGRIYCIGCAAETVQEGRLRCAGCGGSLRLDDDALRYLVLQYVSDDGPTRAAPASPAGLG